MSRMSDQDLGDTQEFSPSSSEESPSPEATQQIAAQAPEGSGAQEAESEPPGKSAPPQRTSRWRWLFGTLVGLIVFVGLGALVGMQSGIRARENKEQLDKAVEAVAQFELGQNDLASGQCAIARQRFAYVIELNPTFPGAAEKLAEAMLCVGVENEPTEQATLAPSATPDRRDVDEIYAEASAYLNASNWDALLPLLDTLRSEYPDFQPVEVDGMYYIALRNRGMERILGPGELEGGIFDLNQAEQIGPLDAEASSFRQWAILYIVGQSFWDVDWGQAVQNFGQIAAAAPNLHDSTFFTAQNRLATAQVEYAQVLIDEAQFLAGGKNWCQAKELMEQANSYSPHSIEVQPTADWIAQKCELNPE